MAGTIRHVIKPTNPQINVSMESGLDGRNNKQPRTAKDVPTCVSMESGLDGRNNTNHATTEREPPHGVSMESGLDGRNN